MIQTLTSIFNNRELAIIVLVIIALIWALSQKSIRQSFYPVIKAITAHHILVAIFLMIIYIEAMLIGVVKLSLWDFSLLKDSVFWVFGVAFIMLFNILKIEKEDGFIKKSILDNLKLMVILQFISNMYVFGFVTEIISLPIVLFLTMMVAYAELDEKNKQVVKLTNAILSIYGLTLIIFSQIQFLKAILSRFQVLSRAAEARSRLYTLDGFCNLPIFAF